MSAILLVKINMVSRYFYCWFIRSNYYNYLFLFGKNLSLYLNFIKISWVGYRLYNFPSLDEINHYFLSFMINSFKLK